MYTASAIKAEAFLTGTITAACYYWLRFDAQGRLKYLLLGAAFSAMSVMTKGIFTLITIASGLVVVWLLLGQWRKLLLPKWWLAAGLSLLMTAPEVLSLYLQFDRHPEKLVFGQNQVSGVRFFLWDSQFGRFFNSGPIKNQGGNPWYFVHVFLWAFLPWVAVFVAAVANGVRGYGARPPDAKAKFLFLTGTFFVTFALFSATEFQLDYYTVILFPFANVLCAHYVMGALQQRRSRLFFASHVVVALSTLALACGLALYVALTPLLVLVLGATLVLLAYALLQRGDLQFKALVLYPVVAVNVLYAFLEGMTLLSHVRYSVPYNVLPVLAGEPTTPVVSFQLDPTVAWELGLYRTSAASFRIDQADRLPAPNKPYFVVLKGSQVPVIADRLGSFYEVGRGAWVDHKTGTLPRQLRLAKGIEPLEDIRILQVSGQ